METNLFYDQTAKIFFKVPSQENQFFLKLKCDKFLYKPSKKGFITWEWPEKEKTPCLELWQDSDEKTKRKTMTINETYISD